jgi:hypothetical protein
MGMSWNPFPGAWRNIVALFPFTKDGRATLIYLAFAGSVPALTAVITWSLYEIRWFDAPALARLDRFYEITMRLCYGMLLGMLAYAAFVSFRAFKAGKDGIEMNSKDDADGAQQTADAAQDKAAEIAEKV